MTDLKVTLLDGSYHEVDSSDLAFRMAAIFAFREGVPKGSRFYLNPS
jgi:elongation factor G